MDSQAEKNNERNLKCRVVHHPAIKVGSASGGGLEKKNRRNSVEE